MRSIPTQLHGTLDYLTGVILIGAPWLLGFAGVVVLPHIVIGLFEFAAGLMTRTRPRHDVATAVGT